MLVRDLGEDAEEQPPSNGKNPDYRGPAEIGKYHDAYSPIANRLKGEDYCGLYLWQSR